MDDSDAASLDGIDRRTILKGVGAAGVAGAIGTGLAVGQPPGGGDDPPGQDDQQNGPPWDYCGCPIGQASKYEFEQDNEEDCAFVHEEGPDVLNVHYHPTDPDQNKSNGDDDVQPCEPIVIDITPKDGYRVTQLCAFGGGDEETVELDEPVEPGETYTYISDLVGGGGQQAAISNFIVCFEPVEEAFVGYQLDLIHGDVLETLDPETDTLYNRQDRLLQAYWSGTGMDENISLEDNADEYQHCLDVGLDIHQDITPENATATACLSLPAEAENDCDLSAFTLVAYSAPVDTWTPEAATQQLVYDYDDEPDLSEDNGTSTACFEVDLPPLE